MLPSLPYLDVDVSHTAVQLEEAGVVGGVQEPAPEEEYEPGSGSEFDEEEPWLATFVDKKPMEPPEEEKQA